MKISLSVKFTPSQKEDGIGRIYFQIIHKRVVRQLNPNISCKNSNWNGVSYVDANGFYRSFVIGDDVFLTPEEAKQKAEEMRVKKIASLKKKIEKLEKLKF